MATTYDNYGNLVITPEEQDFLAALETNQKKLDSLELIQAPPIADCPVPVAAVEEPVLKSNKARRTFYDLYQEAATQPEKDDLLFHQLYKPLAQVVLGKDESVRALYALGDAIASGSYPKPKDDKKATNRAKQKILECTKDMTEAELDVVFNEIMQQLNGNAPKDFQDTLGAGDQVAAEQIKNTLSEAAQEVTENEIVADTIPATFSEGEEW